ncbi:MAG: hypothetical protein JNJ55_07125 [Betaproteobacteria bacterium]|nr:hypothetical protein [Betaproteobacteria bacterium]
MLGVSVPLCANAGNFNASIDISSEAHASETGIRAYPGAVKLPGKPDDTDSARLNFSLGDYGLKVVAVKLTSGDSKERIADFYRTELARFGTVLDCTSPDPAARDKSSRKSKALQCDGERAKRNGFLFKAGLKADQRVVSIEPKGDTTHISLVHIELRGLD